MAQGRFDIAVIGAGAAGLFAATWAGRTAAGRAAGGAAPSIVAIDGARTLGAKILVAGGGRCNVTHHEVTETDFNAPSRHAVRRVLARFGVADTIAFFRDRGVELKREETGKLFPVTDRARDVLDALVSAATEAGVELVHPWRVGAVRREQDGFVISRAGPGPAGGRAAGAVSASLLLARRVILATGGRSLPKSGSDGAGYEFARSLGHSVTPTFPALVPLTLPGNHPLVGLAGVSAPATIEVRVGGRAAAASTGSVLLTHFGLSGPAVLDASRHYVVAGAGGVATQRVEVLANWAPGLDASRLDRELAAARGVSVGRWLAESMPIGTPVVGHAGRGMPERLARCIAGLAGLDGAAPIATLAREPRRRLAAMITAMPLPITGDRGFGHAEVTAGGVPLSEIRLETMESRVCPALHLCGEIIDVDGRLGGFNFQWAWSTGFIAGRGAAAGLGDPAAAT